MNQSPKQAVEELRKETAKNVSFAIQGTVEYSPNDITDYYENRANWVNHRANDILAAVADMLEGAGIIEWVDHALISDPDGKTVMKQRRKANPQVVEYLITELRKETNDNNGLPNHRHNG